jgi:putative transposase
MHSVPKDALSRFKIIAPYLENGLALPEIARHHDLPLRTLRRWVSRYRQGGVSALERARKSSAVFSEPAWKPLAEALALEKPKRSIAGIHRILAEQATKQGFPVPAYATVRAWLKQMEPALLALAHEGRKAYDNKYDLIYRRPGTEPNAIWQADHTLLDIWVYDENGQPVRPWLSIILDDFTRAIAGYYLTLQAPSALQTALVLRQAIWRKSDAAWSICGIPGILYTDHGSDFTSRHIEQVSAELKIRLVFSLPGKPRGRGRIERFFSTVNQEFLSQLPGYAPAGDTKRVPGITLSELESRLHDYLVYHYNQKPHSSSQVAPLTQWNQNGFLPQMPESLEILDALLLTVVKPRQVHPDGIRFQSMRYIDPILAAYIGEAVHIRYDPRDMAEIRVFHNNKFLCRAVCQELAGETVTLKDITQARNQRRRELQKRINQRRSLLDEILSPPSLTLPKRPLEPNKIPNEPKPSRLKCYEND